MEYSIELSRQDGSKIRSIFRSIRSWFLTLGLEPSEKIILSEKEIQASKKISVIVAVHDAPEATRRCLLGLELFGGCSEIIIIDDNSKLETTRNLLKNKCSLNRWKLIVNESSLGHSRASELGISFATRPYLCLLNSDAIVTQHSWLGVVRSFESDEKIAVCGPSTSHTSGPQVVRRALHCRHYWSDKQICAFAQKYVSKHSHSSVLEVPMVGGFAFFVRRSVWDMLGGFDQKLPDYGNESEFCRRVYKSNLRVVWTKESYIHHLGSESYGRTLGREKINMLCSAAKSYMDSKL